MANLTGLRRWGSELAAIEEEEQLDEEKDDFQMPTCRLCIEKAKRPVLLSCGHVFCWSCIVIATGHNRVCPRCKLPHNLGPEDMKHQIHQFRTSYQLWRQGRAKGARGQVKDISQKPLMLREVSKAELRAASAQVSQQQSPEGLPMSPKLNHPGTKFAPALPLERQIGEVSAAMFEPMSNFEQHVWQPMTEICLGDAAIAATETPQNTTRMGATTAAVSTKFQVGKAAAVSETGKFIPDAHGMKQLQKIDTSLRAPRLSEAFDGSETCCPEEELDFTKLLPEPKSTVVTSPTAQDKFAVMADFNSPQRSQRASKGKPYSSSKHLGTFQDVPSKEKAKENAGRKSKFAVGRPANRNPRTAPMETIAIEKEGRCEPASQPFNR